MLGLQTSTHSHYYKILLDQTRPCNSSSLKWDKKKAYIAEPILLNKLKISMSKGYCTHDGSNDSSVVVLLQVITVRKDKGRLMVNWRQAICQTGKRLAGMLKSSNLQTFCMFLCNVTLENVRYDTYSNAIQSKHGIYTNVSGSDFKKSANKYIFIGYHTFAIMLVLPICMGPYGYKLRD